MKKINSYFTFTNTFIKKNISLIQNIFLTSILFLFLVPFINTFLCIFLLNILEEQSHLVKNQNFLQKNFLDFGQINKTVLDRNIFNASGKIPLENSFEKEKNFALEFRNKPCVEKPSNFPVELLGIIYTGNPQTNLVTFKDPHIETADVYKEGQTIIDNDLYEIYRIPNSSTVEIKNKNTKICLSTDSKKNLFPNTNPLEANLKQFYELDSQFVNEQIGTGFSKILNSARLAPESLEGKIVGFKIYDIIPKSLFNEIGLENGDLITQVNDTNLEDPSQGFKIYEVLRDEEVITFEVHRADQKMTKKVIVR